MVLAEAGDSLLAAQWHCCAPLQKVKSQAPLQLLTPCQWKCNTLAGAHCLSILKNGMYQKYLSLKPGTSDAKSIADI